MVGNLLRYRGVDASTSTVGVLDGEFVQTADTSTYSFPSGNGNSDWSRVGQGYTFGPTPSEIQGLVFRLKKTGTATGMVNALITTTNHNNIQVRSSTFVAADSISTSPTNYFFDLSGTPTASTLYYIMLETTDGLIDATNTVDFIVESGAEATAPDALRAFQYPGTQSTIGFDVAYKVYSVSGSTSDPVTEDPITAIDSGSLAVVTISNILSTDETNALKIDVSQLSPEEGTGRPVREV
jgi:hypothetical protein